MGAPHLVSKWIGVETPGIEDERVVEPHFVMKVREVADFPDELSLATSPHVLPHLILFGIPGLRLELPDLPQWVDV